MSYRKNLLHLEKLFMLSIVTQTLEDKLTHIFFYHVGSNVKLFAEFSNIDIELYSTSYAS